MQGLEVRGQFRGGWNGERVCVKLVEQHIGVLREDAGTVSQGGCKPVHERYFVVRTNMCVDMCCRNITVVLAFYSGD